MGRYFLLQYGNYNWFHKILVQYTEYNWEWESIAFTTNFEFMFIMLQVLIGIVLLYIGKECFRKIRMI